MLFNSYVFIFCFLPLVLAGYALLRRASNVLWPIGWLVLASLVYYAWWRPEFLLLLLFSITVNFAFGTLIIDGGLSRAQSRAILTIGIAFNLCLLGYFKYAGFFVANVDFILGLQWAVPSIVLPIGISFITFQKIAFLVDAHRGLVRNFTLLNYAFFVTFFPQLIAGPITHHSEIMPQIGPSPGYLYHPNRPDPQTLFERFPNYIWSSAVPEPDRATFDQAAFDATLEIIQIARANNLELIFLIGPSHPYPDYYYDVIGAWGVIEEWLTKLSALATVYSFSQPNDWVDEPISPHMTYWYDTFHYSLAMGRGMLRSLAGVPTSGLPDNFMERLTPERVASHTERRRAAERRWAEANPSLVAQFEEARRKWLAREKTPH